jgi:regulation of enolase protein 1 (concanavalin A-like superfamily)
MPSFTLSALPGTCQWRNHPREWHSDGEQSLTITAGAETDWFVDPAGSYRIDSAPSALFTPPERDFRLSARVAVSFAAAFDAGVLQVYARDDLWAKLCLEYSPQRRPTIVTVVTRGASDDCNGSQIDGAEVYLRIARQAPTFAFHYSLDGRYWQLARYFTLEEVDRLQIGLSAQAPTGRACTAVFSEITYQQGGLADLRNGS